MKKIIKKLKEFERNWTYIEKAKDSWDLTNEYIIYEYFNDNNNFIFFF